MLQFLDGEGRDAARRLPGVNRLLRRELERLRRHPGRRSSRATLNELSSQYMFFYLGRKRRDVRGLIPSGNVGLAVSSYLGRRFGSDREMGMHVCEREAARLVGLRSRGGFTADERLAWQRWSPLILTLPGVARWSRAEKSALIEVVRAKGGRHESDYVHRFDAHRKLRRAVLALSRREPEPL